jgi:outer membrane protein assembly factor BamB
LLFGAADGYFYAVNLADGTILRKTKIDNQNLFFSGVHSSSPIQIDPKNQELFWSYAVEQNEKSNYTGALISLDLAKGNVMWITQTNSSCGGLAFNNSTDRLFLTTYRFAADVGLWIFNATTGDLIHNQQFDHRVLPPVVLGKETFVTGDLWLYSYQ